MVSSLDSTSVTTVAFAKVCLVMVATPRFGKPVCRDVVRRWRLRFRPTLAKDVLICYVSVIIIVAAKKLAAKCIAAKIRLGTLCFQIRLQSPRFESSTLFCKMIVRVCVLIVQLLCLISVAVLPNWFCVPRNFQNWPLTWTWTVGWNKRRDAQVQPGPWPCCKV